ncbi:hypothetical protein D7294_07885 [Streptomyces hoynatensis]|uniref:alcohol dehydrogenase n=1 Tax=Streptomyces hoynatensis TaxID=1141874 RepID=A0A3A9ZCE5_9ACTN|nr:hypothetical protein D7294_07885 [Streptomyces hoynatensis]
MGRAPGPAPAAPSRTRGRGTGRGARGSAGAGGPPGAPGRWCAGKGPGGTGATFRQLLCQGPGFPWRPAFGALGAPPSRKRFPHACRAGHEIAGRIDALGEGVEGWEVGERVAVGRFGGSCGRCPACRAGALIHRARLRVPGGACPGGYAEAVVVPATAPARIPDELTAVEAAPMGCAGVSAFRALRRGPARPGDLVAVLGLGGLGHLGVQFAARLGCETVAIARGAGKAGAARRFGAHHYLDSIEGNVAGRLRALGGAAAVPATAWSSPPAGDPPGRRRGGCPGAGAGARPAPPPRRCGGRLRPAGRPVLCSPGRSAGGWPGRAGRRGRPLR